MYSLQSNMCLSLIKMNIKQLDEISGTTPSCLGCVWVVSAVGNAALIVCG